jgi:hypothetical protein
MRAMHLSCSSKLIEDRFSDVRVCHRTMVPVGNPIPSPDAIRIPMNSPRVGDSLTKLSMIDSFRSMTAFVVFNMNLILLRVIDPEVVDRVVASLVTDLGKKLSKFLRDGH